MPDSELHPGSNSDPALERRILPGLRQRVQRACVALVAVATTLGAWNASAQAPSGAPQHFVVVLDAAHGGADSGGRLGDSAGQTEKAYTLALSVRLRSLLSARGISVVTTRESDTSIDADHRAEIANRANAQACITLHASESGTGIHIYASSLAPALPSAMLPWKTAQAAWLTRSLALAGVVNSAMLHAGLNVALGRTDLPAVDCMACPALAIEIGRQVSQDNSSGDGLDDAGYQAGVAQALAAAILEWKTKGWSNSAVPVEASRQ